VTVHHLSGDFNGLNTVFLEERCGQSQIVSDIIHGKKVLDKVLINCPDLFRSCTLRSLLKTKHMAVIVSSDPTQVSCYVDQRKHAAVYDVRAPAIDKLRDWQAASSDC
jgi:hypothetical protein